MEAEAVRWVTVRGRRIPIRASQGRRHATPANRLEGLLGQVEQACAEMQRDPRSFKLRPSEARNFAAELLGDVETARAARREADLANALARLSGALEDVRPELAEELWSLRREVLYGRR